MPKKLLLLLHTSKTILRWDRKDPSNEAVAVATKTQLTVNPEYIETNPGVNQF